MGILSKIGLIFDTFRKPSKLVKILYFVKFRR